MASAVDSYLADTDGSLACANKPMFRWFNLSLTETEPRGGQSAMIWKRFRSPEKNNATVRAFERRMLSGVAREFDTIGQPGGLNFRSEILWPLLTWISLPTAVRRHPIRTLIFQNVVQTVQRRLAR